MRRSREIHESSGRVINDRASAEARPSEVLFNTHPEPSATNQSMKLVKTDVLLASKGTRAT
jgi:hypothetical protein